MQRYIHCGNTVQIHGSHGSFASSEMHFCNVEMCIVGGKRLWFDITEAFCKYGTLGRSCIYTPLCLSGVFFLLYFSFPQ